MSGSLPALALILTLVSPVAVRAGDVPAGADHGVTYPPPIPLTCIPVDPCGFYALPGVPAGVPGSSPPPPLAAGLPAPRPAGGYARPTAAPPSAAPAPAPVPPSPGPTAPSIPRERGPAVSESRSYYDTYPVALDRSTRALGDRSSVAFWNLTDRDLALRVDGKPQPLQRGQSITLELGRQFVWQVEGRDPQRENIPLGESALEIVIRR